MLSQSRSILFAAAFCVHVANGGTSIVLISDPSYIKGSLAQQLIWAPLGMTLGVGFGLSLCLWVAFFLFERYRRLHGYDYYSDEAGIWDLKSTKTGGMESISPNGTQAGILGGTLTREFAGINTTLVSGQRELTVPAFLEFHLKTDYVYTKEIARGGGGSIHLGEPRKQELSDRIEGTDKKIIVKVIDLPAKATDEVRETVKRSFHQEIALMYFFRDHKNFAKFYGYSLTPWTILMKFYSYGSLQDLIHEPKKNDLTRGCKWTSILVKNLALDLVVGLKFMHENGFAHCDFKSANVLIDYDAKDKRMFCVLTDFGIARVVTNDHLLVHHFRVNKKEGASFLYAAPEVLKRMFTNSHDKPSEREVKAGDTYALAITFYELLTRSFPWKDLKDVKQLYVALMQNKRPHFPSRIIDIVTKDSVLMPVYESMLMCWEQNPLIRPSLHEVYNKLYRK